MNFGVPEEMTDHLLHSRDKEKLKDFAKRCGSGMLLNVDIGPCRPSYWTFVKGPGKGLTVEIREQFFPLPNVLVR
jgi:hypothetical protein